MKKSIKSIVSLCAIYSLTTGLALAEPADVVIGDENCTLRTEGYYDEDAGFYVVGPLVSGERHKVTSNNENGNISITCSQEFEPTTTGRSVIYNFENTGLLCYVSGFGTDDWHQVISRNGNAKLTCHYHSD